MPNNDEKKVLLKVTDLKQWFPLKKTKLFQKEQEYVRANDGITLNIYEGETVGLVGESGCGKSTILRLIAGLIRPTTGEIRLGGKPIVGAGPDRGMVFQKATLFPWLTVEKNVSFSLRMQKKQDKELVEHMLKMVGLEDFRKDYPHQLSGGMAQRVALVRSLINHPDILLLDEPLGALDAFTRMNMQDEILNIWREQKQTVVMVTHDVEEAIYMGTRVLVMEPRPGRVKADIPIELAEPKQRDSEEFQAYRNRILKMLDLKHHTDH